MAPQVEGLHCPWYLAVKRETEHVRVFAGIEERAAILFPVEGSLAFEAIEPEATVAFETGSVRTGQLTMNGDYRVTQSTAYGLVTHRNIHEEVVGVVIRFFLGEQEVFTYASADGLDKELASWTATEEQRLASAEIDRKWREEGVREYPAGPPAPTTPTPIASDILTLLE